jgi:EAL domain-containing protein (putative c-di-GMP-specific phosphodiesterase class I)
MAVNVSATCLLEAGWTDGVLAAIECHRVRPDRVVLEITEDVMLTDPERSLTALARLSAAGVQRLTGFGVDIAQGYHIARPMPAADVEA